MTMEGQIPHSSIEHLHGPEEVPYAEDELVLVCLVRDGRPYVKSFVEHHLSLGVKHMVFLDNGSTDGTVEALKKYDNVSVLRTELPFKEYKHLMRQYLVARFGKDRWSLYVDMDELFDYPYSDIVSLSSLIGYLNSKSYTAVVAQMLDMFPEKPLVSDQARNLDEPLKELHRFYDISNLGRRSMKGLPRLRNNTLESDEIEALSDGIRNTIFDAVPYLTRFALIFSDGRVKPFEDSGHWVDGARVADLTCVLFHYKFVNEHFHKKVASAVREEQYWKNSVTYKKYMEVLASTPSLQLRRETSKEIEDVNELLENGFLVVSEDYVSWVNTEEEKSVLRAASQSEPQGLAEAFLKSRRQERAKILKIQRLERHLRDRDREIQASQKALQKAQGASKQNQHLKRRVGRLEQRLEGMQASRIWKLAKMLSRIKARVLGLGRRSSS